MIGAKRDALRLLPGQEPSASVSAAQQPTAHTEFKVHDSMRHGPSASVSQDLKPSHSLDTHLQRWEANQDQMRAAMQRQIYGLHAPLRTKMERSILESIQTRLPHLPSARLGQSILSGRDEWLDWEDVLCDPQMSTRHVDVHGAAETNRLGWSRPL